jgi:hypothetical protein
VRHGRAVLALAPRLRRRPCALVLFNFPRIGMLAYLLLMCTLFDAKKSMPKRII